jgi:hypothetical protein
MTSGGLDFDTCMKALVKVEPKRTQEKNEEKSGPVGPLAL